MSSDTRQEISKLLLKVFPEERVSNIMSTLELKLFFKLPASSRYHLAQQGGLAVHSLNVCKKALELRESLCPWIPEA